METGKEESSIMVHYPACYSVQQKLPSALTSGMHKNAQESHLMVEVRMAHSSFMS